MSPPTSRRYENDGARDRLDARLERCASWCRHVDTDRRVPLRRSGLDATQYIRTHREHWLPPSRDARAKRPARQRPLSRERPRARLVRSPQAAVVRRLWNDDSTKAYVRRRPRRRSLAYDRSARELRRRQNASLRRSIPGRRSGRHTCSSRAALRLALRNTTRSPIGVGKPLQSKSPPLAALTALFLLRRSAVLYKGRARPGAVSLLRRPPEEMARITRRPLTLQQSEAAGEDARGYRPESRATFDDAAVEEASATGEPWRATRLLRRGVVRRGRLPGQTPKARRHALRGMRG